MDRLGYWDIDEVVPHTADSVIVKVRHVQPTEYAVVYMFIPAGGWQCGSGVR